ncbi:MAG: hypothetical protein LUG66_08895 [Clostridiales bacterium]|nr:hypothetical protein [Clostridiales bacterium]
MILPMKEQGLLFLFICFSGFCFGFVYDVLRLFRRCFHCGGFFGLVSDLVFWVCAFAAVFWFLLGVNYGEVRIYMVLGFMVGMVVYYNSLSGYFIFYSEKALKVIKRLLKLILSPVVKALLKPVKFINLRLKKYAKCGIIAVRKFFKVFFAPFGRCFKRKTQKKQRKKTKKA